MIVIGIDAHKRIHTAVVADQNGSQLSTRTIRTTSKDHLALLRWGAEQCDDRMWVIEDCRHLSRPPGAGPVGRRRTGRARAAEADGECARRCPYLRKV